MIMKQKITFTILLLLLYTVGHAQNQLKTKCKTVHDKELGMDVYADVDSSAISINDESFNDLLLSKEFRFKEVSKKYPEGQMVNFAYMIGTDGKAAFIKVLSPKGDKEIEEEAKRLTAMIPVYKPCKCGQEAVPCVGKINMRLVRKDKKE